MTMDDFKAGKRFTNTGHFFRFHNKLLYYNPSLDELQYKDAECSWIIKNIAENRVTVFNRKFGNITIYFKDCKLEGAA